MILGHSEIIKRIEKEKLIEDAELDNVEGAGVDLRLNKIYRIKSGAKLGRDERKLPEIEEVKEDSIKLKPQEYVLVETKEKVNIPENISARMLPRSTLHRSGVWVFTAFIDPGYKGKLIFGMKNMGPETFEIEKEARIAQIIFEKVEGATKNYNGRYQNGKIT